VSVYVIADIVVTDPERYADYVALSGPSVEAHGGRFVVRGGAVTPLEGGWEPRRVVVTEFPTAEQARAWYDSPEYQRARAIRQEASEGRFVLVEGV
jgi:uncharacterized protein (DUF1330 family)